MAFFPRQFYNSEASFAPLFRLLEDYDDYSRQGARKAPHWQPKFDVRETEQGYELHGELPGVNKENVHIEFTEPQTLLIRGKTERTYTSGSPSAGSIEDSRMSGAITEGNDKASSHQATVENEDESAEPKESSKDVTLKAPLQQKQPVDSAKYWLTERSVGEFSRTFNFPTPFDQDAVSASFKDGILNIIVPKAKKHESRRININ